jgi:DedD protein
MDPQLRQRLIGAAVLVSLAVLIIPAFLDQDRPRPSPVVARDMAPMPVYEFPDSPAAIEPEDETLISDGLLPPAVGEAPLEPAPTGEVSEPPKNAAGESSVPASAAVAQGQTEPSPPVLQEATVKTGWIIQLGSFSSMANADSLRAKLIVEGFTALVLPLKGAGYTSYRVRVKAPGSRAEAERVAARLKQSGYVGIILRDE